DSDADQLARLSPIPAIVWVGLFLLVNVAVLVLGGWWILRPVGG
ncbi:M50 family metallopeptidase, partial [Rhodococcus sp. (in: high G+C Gram-positive bacteria)]